MNFKKKKNILKMFKWLFYYWYVCTDLPSINFKINIWAYINMKIFKNKIQNYIVYFILGLNNLYLKELKIFYKNISFEFFYFKCIYILIFLIIFFWIFLIF